MAGPFRFVITARDVGAAGHLLALAAGLREAGDHVSLVMQGPALVEARGRGISCIDADEWCKAGTPLIADIINSVAQRISRIRPTSVICGLSGFHTNGIDEAVMLAARIQGVQCIAMQDFWGDVKCIEGKGADHYLVLDEQAAALTRVRTSAPCHVVGSVKHEWLRTLDPDSSRKSFRRRHAIGSDSKVIGFFGQHLGALPGYWQVLRDFAGAVVADVRARAVYRPHPLEDAAAIAASINIFNSVGCRPIVVAKDAIEKVVCGVDCVVSCFSTVGMDAAYLVRMHRQGPSVVYACYPEDVNAYWQLATQLQELPPVQAQYALRALSSRSLSDVLYRACDRSAREVMTKAIMATLENPAEALERAVACVRSLGSAEPCRIPGSVVCNE